MKRLLALSILLVGCISESDFKRLMRQEGITDWRSTGPDLLACGEDDTISGGFTGVKNGQPIAGVICGGAFKGYTIRYK